MHDLLAELRGYRDEHAEAVTYGRSTAAAAIADEIARVETAISGHADRLDAHARTLDAGGQDVPAALAHAEAHRHRDALTPAVEPENTAEATPRERAVRRKNS